MSSNDAKIEPPTYNQAMHYGTVPTAPPMTTSTAYGGAPPPYNPNQYAPPPNPNQHTTVIIQQHTRVVNPPGTCPRRVNQTAPIRTALVVNPCLWIYSIIAMFFCLPLGCISFAFLLVAYGHEEKGNYGDAIINARLARVFASLAIILSVVLVTVSISLRYTVAG